MSKGANHLSKLARSSNIRAPYGSGAFSTPSEPRTCQDVVPWNSNCSSCHTFAGACVNIFKTTAEVEKMLSTQKYANCCIVGMAEVMCTRQLLDTIRSTYQVQNKSRLGMPPILVSHCSDYIFTLKILS